MEVLGTGSVNDLEVKLVDRQDENVWWWTRRGEAFPSTATRLRFKKRQLSFAWGPGGGGEPRDLAALEIAVVAREGGRGAVWISSVELVERPVPSVGAVTARVGAGASAAGSSIAAVVDGDPATVWRSVAAGAPLDVVLDLGGQREFGGLALTWADGAFARDYDVDLSDDGTTWTTVRQVRGGDGGWDPLALPESEARLVRLRLLAAGGGGAVALGEVTVEPLAFGATPNAFVAEVAKRAPRGEYPRAFSGEQSYWTVVGVPAGVDKGLLSEDGAVEGMAGGAALEPFLEVDGVLVSWAEAAVTQSLPEGFLPLPSVAWQARGVGLTVETLADGPASQPGVQARYRVRSLDGRPHTVRLALALRPFQVDPPSQFLNGAGGVAPIRRLSLQNGWIFGDTKRLARVLTPGGAWRAAAFDSGGVVALLRGGFASGASEVDDPSGLASGAVQWTASVGPAELVVVAELPSTPAAAGSVASAASAAEADAAFSRRAEAVAAAWRERLGRFELRLPAGAPPLAAAMRSALAHVLILAEGPALHPGARSYRRAWIRDGALMSEALLRLGHGEEAREFLRWYAGFQFADGKIPCCVDRRGGDPVPENDAPGEFLHLVSDVYRYGGDRGLLDALWPRVERTVAFIDALRAQRSTPEYASGEKRAFYGLLPESISHEGYSAKAMHSFWDDFWALRGLDDAVALAAARGEAAESERWRVSRDEFARDLDAALAGTIARHGLDVLPGAVELGDFDPTSSTIALAPGDLLERLPPAPLRRTFARYMEEAERRWSGTAAWDAYTPYEWRIVGSLVRLGERAQAVRLTEWLLADRRPAAWNQWPEVVRRDVRQVGFLGDLPHGWVEADFLRSALDLFAYERQADASLVLAAGVPLAWLDGDGVSVRGLATPYGTLSYTLWRRGAEIEYAVAGGLSVPSGGLVLAGPALGRVGTVTVDGHPIPSARDIRLRCVPASVRITFVDQAEPRVRASAGGS